VNRVSVHCDEPYERVEGSAGVVFSRARDVAVSPRQSLCRNMARVVLVQFAYRGEVFLLTDLLSACEPMAVRGASRGRVSW
jgi:hypothetical protein